MHFATLFVGALFCSATVAAQSADPEGSPPLAPVSQAEVQDDLSQVTPAWAAMQLLEAQDRGIHAGTALSESPLGEPRRFVGQVPVKADDAEQLISDRSVESMLTKPLYSAEGEHLWTRVRRMKASFGADGFTVYPKFGKAATENYAVRFDLESVTVGGTDLAFHRSPASNRNSDSVTLDRGSVAEVYHVGLDSIEQTFVFDRLPAGGDLVLDVDVDSNLGVAENTAGIQFLNEAFGGVTYGDAFVVDASGDRLPIDRTWTGSSIRLTVPAAFLAGATFPITVDPPVTSFTSTAGTPDDSNVDVCWAGGGTGVYWTAFQDYVNGTQSDVYAASFDTSGVVVNFIAIETGADDWIEPKIAHQFARNQCLVVASTMLNASGIGAVRGRMIDCTTATTPNPAFIISTSGAAKVHPDVGGNNADIAAGAYFCVTWSSVWTPGTSEQIQYRIVDWDESLVTGVTSVTTLGEVHTQPAISETHGEDSFSGDYWTMVWVDDASANGFGRIMARRVVFSGSTSLGAGNFTVDGTTNCAAPVVTSRFNRTLLSTNDRPSLVAYERDFPLTGGGNQRSIYACVVSDGDAEAPVGVSFMLEDFDSDLDQREPSIAGDGNCFYLAYSEVFYGSPNGTDYDMYMVSGCISDLLNGASVALAERHERLAFSGTAERNPAVATIWDGEDDSLSDDGIAIWEDRNVANGGTLEGATLEIPTLNQSVTRAVGRQYCDANPNSGGASQGRQSSWSWLLGNQSVGSDHTFICTDMPLSTFGYAIAGTTPGNVNMPGGALGRLCVLGGGRYINQVSSSGTTGEISTTIDPMSLPQPTGFVSASIGETWYFQYWHRDTAPAGGASSNFSSACAMQFTN